MSWQPIDTAPKNEWVLVVDARGDRFAAHKQFGYWYAWYDWAGDDLKIEGATHWMPIPEGPK